MIWCGVCGFFIKVAAFADPPPLLLCFLPSPLVPCRYSRLTYTSDYFPQLMDMAERLIKAGHLYADDTPMEQMRDERMKMQESKCRNRGAEENLTIWKEMLAGSEVGLANCMRFKIDMKVRVHACMRAWPLGREANAPPAEAICMRCMSFLCSRRPFTSPATCCWACMLPCLAQPHVHGVCRSLHSASVPLCEDAAS